MTQQVEEYLLGRGASTEWIREMGLREWVPLSDAAPSEEFRAKYGDTGVKLSGALITPLLSPRMKVLGFEARSITKKIVSRFVLPGAAWNPIWIGIQAAMPAIWSGGAVWIVEGIFDLFAMRHVVSQRDAVLSSLQARITDEHLLFLKRFASSVNMVYDRDEAGRRATTVALGRMRKKGISCRDVPYRGYKDPGEMWEKTGTEGVQRAFARYT